MFRQNPLGSDKERGRDVYSQVTKKSRDFFFLYIFEIFAARIQGEAERMELGVWGFCLGFFKTPVSANIWKDFMVPKYCLAQVSI